MTGLYLGSTPLTLPEGMSLYVGSVQVYPPAAAADGEVGGAGAVVQNSGTHKWDGVGGTQSFSMPANFTAGNDVIVSIGWYQDGQNPITAISVNGTAATRVAFETVSVARTELWIAQGVAGGGAGVSITLGSGGGTYFNANAIEVTPTQGLDVSATGNGTSTAPAFTSPATHLADALVAAVWRDNDGINNTAGTPVPAPLTQGFFVADGVNELGGASGFKHVTRLGAQAAVFAASPSAHYYGVIGVFPFALPVVHCGTCYQPWQASDAWAPLTLSRAVDSTSKLLVTVGAWWDDNTRPSGLPTDNHGTFTAAINPTIPGTEEPVVTQVCYQTAPSVNTHTVTPPNIAAGGDGYLTLLELAGINASAPVRDSGRARQRHAPVSHPDPDSIQSLTVATDGSAAQVGDIAIAVFVQDPNSVTNSDIAWTIPAGWCVLENRFNATDAPGVLILCGTVTTAGRITVSTSWTDADTFVAEAAVVVFAKA